MNVVIYSDSGLLVLGKQHVRMGEDGRNLYKHDAWG